MRLAFQNPFLIIVVFLLFSSCNMQEQPTNDIFKTTEGEYASRMGKFVAKYPSKPFHYIYRKKIDKEKDLVADYHSVITTIGDTRIFNVEYFVMDEEFLANKDMREIKDLMMFDVNNFFQKKGFTVDFFNDKKLQSFDGVYFSYKPTPALKRALPKAKGKGKAILRNNILYYVYFLGVFDREAQDFIDSFRFTS